jgi:glycerol-3-phosphate acyltransferase PlsX
VRVLLVGLESAIAPLLPDGTHGVELVPTTEVVAMHDPPASVRTKKDSSIVVSAELVRDGKADAMVSAGNTGAAMAAALLRMGRIRGVARPAIAVPVPVPGRQPQTLVDGGATVGCTAEWLRQFAIMGREYARWRMGVDEPRIGLLSNGEEAGKGDDLRKAVYPLLESIPGFIGNVEGRDFMHDTVDVIVTDGFTGNVALKTVEGAIRGTARLVYDALSEHPEVMPALLAAAEQLDPDHIGGCTLLGVNGVCVISHGSSNALAMRSSVARARECVDGKVVERMKGAVADAG